MRSCFFSLFCGDGMGWVFRCFGVSVGSDVVGDGYVIMRIFWRWKFFD